VRNFVVARNYAEALLAIAEQEKAVERFGELLDAVAGVIASDPTVLGVMMSPRVRKDDKKAMLAHALEGLAPASFAKFLGSVVQRGRQGMLSDVSEAYQVLADKHFNRLHASVITAREADPALRQAIIDRLTKTMGKTVVPHFRADPAIVGGVIVRLGDRVLDGSLRRRIQILRSRMLQGRQ
jgi:F-type H+-transporting ATPase subunit delta